MVEGYKSAFAEHLRHPRNMGEFEGPDAQSMVRDTVCGDLLRLTLRIRNDCIEGAKFRAFGCGATIASSSMLTVMLGGMKVQEALALGERDVARALEGLPGNRMHSSRLAQRATVEALKRYRDRPAGEPPRDKAEAGGLPPNNSEPRR